MSMEFELEGGGHLRMWEDAGRVFFRCERALNREGLYKVWIRGDGGELLLGTLVPEGDRLMLGRAVWPMELRRCGCWPVRGGRCNMVFRFQNQTGDGWRWEQNPQQFVDAETAHMGEWRAMLCYKGKDELWLACPLQKDRPIPLAALFCLAKPQRIRGDLCLVWRFDGRGRPCQPGTEGEERAGRAR